MTKFFRIRPIGLGTPSRTEAHPTTLPEELLAKLRTGSALIMADWQDAAQRGVVTHLGVVSSVDCLGGLAGVIWRPASAFLYPSPQGGVANWKKTPGWFGFSPDPTKRYRLEKLLSKAFPDLNELSFGSVRRRDAATTSSTPLPGYIYLIKSDHGTKIGRSINPRTRTQVLGSKMPFDNEVVHLQRTDDCVRAEQVLHDQYREKRIRGEWFDLNENDIKCIISMGDSIVRTESIVAPTAAGDPA